LVRGQLFSTDLSEVQPLHDAVAAGGQAQAEALGDFSHDALTGSGLLGTASDEFLAIDRWTSSENMLAFYSDPAVAQGFAQLFNGDPTLEFFLERPDWHTWGSMESGDAFDPYFFVIARGHLAESDPALAQAAHDVVAAAGEGSVTAVGDVAHIVFTGLEDPQEFVAVDIWSDSAAIEAIYTDPDFAAAFGTLFDAPPSLQIYQSTDWHQW